MKTGRGRFDGRKGRKFEKRGRMDNGKAESWENGELRHFKSEDEENKE